MTDKTSLGNRMKKYESAFNFMFPIRFPLIIRLDGSHFHSQVKKWKCKKPFDEHLITTMQYTSKVLCETIPGAQIAYTQSDEITILIRDDISIHSEPVFGKEINKILSIFASRASNIFNWKFFNLGNRERSINEIPFKMLAEFDCRGFILPENEIINAFIWRQKDFERNSIQMVARNYFSHKQLNKKNNSGIQDMLMLEKGVNWNDLPTHLKRGACIIKKEVSKEVPKRDKKGKKVEGNEIIKRHMWVIDLDIPIFTKNKNYINKYAKIYEN